MIPLSKVLAVYRHRGVAYPLYGSVMELRVLAMIHTVMRTQVNPPWAGEAWPLAWTAAVPYLAK